MYGPRQVYAVEFDSELIEENEYSKYQAVFKKFGGVAKLFLNYNTKQGAALYFQQKHAEIAAEELIKNPVFDIKVTKVHETYFKHKYSSIYNSNMEEEIYKYDIFGNKLKLLVAPDGEFYIPLNHIAESGFLLYDENITRSFKESDKVAMNRLKVFLMNQAQIFMQFEGTKLHLKDVKKAVNEVMGEVTDGKPLKTKNDVYYAPPRTQQTRTFSTGSNSHNEFPRSPQTESRNGDTGETLRRPRIFSDAVNKSPKTPPMIPTETPKTSKPASSAGSSPKFGLPMPELHFASTSASTSQASKPAENGESSSIINNFRSSLLEKLKNMKTGAVKTNQYPPGKVITDSHAEGKGSLSSIRKLSANECICYILMDGFEEHALMINDITPEPHESIMKGAFGDLVIVDKYIDNEMSYARGIVIETLTDGYKVAQPDFAEVANVKKIYKQSNKYKDIPEMCVLIRGSAEAISHIENEDPCFSMQGYGKIKLDGLDDILTCSRWIPDNFATPQAVANKPNPSQETIVSNPKPPQKVFTKVPVVQNPLKVKDIVLIGSIDGNNLYLRTKELNMLVKKIASEANDLQVQALTNPPAVGQIVIQRTDNEWERCLIQDINEQMATVKYIDYNKIGIAALENLKYADKLAEYPATMHVVKLLNYENCEFSTVGKQFLNSLIKKDKFIVHSINNNVVELLDGNKNQLSNILTQLDKPPYKRLQDLGMRQLAVGETAQLVILTVDGLNAGYIYGIRSEDIEFITSSLDLEVKEEETEVPLNLHKDELCIAKYEDIYCRASVLRETEDDKYEILFIDYGNVVKMSLDEIRVMPQHNFKLGAPFAIKLRLKEYLNEKNELEADAFQHLSKQLDLANYYDMDILAKGDDYYDINIPLLDS